MKDVCYGVFSFESSHQAMAAEQCSSEIKGARLIPMPPEISAGCGMALRVNEDDIESAIKFLNENNIPFAKVNKLEIKDRKRIVSDL